MDLVNKMDKDEAKGSSKELIKFNKTSNKGEKRSFRLGKFSYTDLNVKARLLLAFSVSMLFMLMIGIGNLISFQSVHTHVEEMVTEDLILMKNFDNVSYYSARRLAAVRGYFSTSQGSYLDTVDQYTELINIESEKIIKAGVTIEIENTFKELAALDVYLQENVIDLMKDNKRSEAVRNMNSDYNPKIEKLMNQISDLSLAQSDIAKAKSVEVLDLVRTTMITMSIVLVVALAVGVIAILFFANSFTKPIIKVMARLKSISEGILGQEALEVTGKGEISQLMASTNALQDRLIDIISQISTAAEELAQHSEELSQSSNEVKSGSEQVAMTMQELAIGTENQAHSASQLAVTMDQFGTDFARASEGSEKINKASHKVLELSATGKDLMNASSQQMENINQIVQESVGMMTKLEKGTQEINKLVVIIRSIADQTNLLALNAAIEAARAGEHGRGFSVVADEVRKLSEQVGESVKEITVFVENIQEESKHVTDSLADGASEAKAGLAGITTTRTTFDQISGSLDQMVGDIESIGNDISHLSQASGEMGHAISEIASVSEESAAGVEETSAASQEITSTMEEVAVNAGQIAKQAELLNTLVGNFQLH